MERREYTDAERTARGLNEWHDDPEMFIANLNARVKALEAAVSDLQLSQLKAKGL